MNSERGVPRAQLMRRIGKKAIFYGRMASALGVPAYAAPKVSFFKKVKGFHPTRRQIIVTACLIILAAGGVTGGYFYQEHRKAQAYAAAKAEAERAAKANAVAQECYQKKTTEKSSMLGKITFDQLYDGDSCTSTQ